MLHFDKHNEFIITPRKHRPGPSPVTPSHACHAYEAGGIRISSRIICLIRYVLTHPRMAFRQVRFGIRFRPHGEPSQPTWALIFLKATCHLSHSHFSERAPGTGSRTRTRRSSRFPGCEMNSWGGNKLQISHERKARGRREVGARGRNFPGPLRWLSRG